MVGLFFISQGAKTFCTPFKIFLFYFHQFNLEIQFLACHLMIGIKSNRLLFLRSTFTGNGCPY